MSRHTLSTYGAVLKCRRNMAKIVLTLEEQRFITNTLRNVIFDMREDDPDKWWAQCDELNQVLEILGDDQAIEN